MLPLNYLLFLLLVDSPVYVKEVFEGRHDGFLLILQTEVFSVKRDQFLVEAFDENLYRWLHIQLYPTAAYVRVELLFYF